MRTGRRPLRSCGENREGATEELWWEQGGATEELWCEHIWGAGGRRWILKSCV